MEKRTKPRYLPKVVLAKLKTAVTWEEVQQSKAKSFTRNERKAIFRSLNLFDGLEVCLSKWNWDNYKMWHLHNWKNEIDATIQKAIYEAEQFYPFSDGRYKNDFAQFEKDWKAGMYDPGAMVIFTDAQVEVLEVVQEEVNHIDPEKVKREVRKAEDIKRDQQRKRRIKARKGGRYQKRYV